MQYHYQDYPLEKSNSALVRWFGFDHLVPERAVTSYWISTKALLCVRIVTTLYSTAIIWIDIGISAVEGNFQHAISHFTRLTYIGLHAYLVTALYHHIRYILGHYELQSFFQQPSIINYMFYYLYHSICVFNIITPVVYWCSLSPTLTAASDEGYFAAGSTLEWWITTSLHGVSFVLMMTEVLLTRMQMTVRMVVIILINAILYMLLTFIIYARVPDSLLYLAVISTGWWVYSFLGWSHGGLTAVWYLGLAAAFIVAFFLIYLVHLLRDWLARPSIKQG